MVAERKEMSKIRIIRYSLIICYLSKLEAAFEVCEIKFVRKYRYVKEVEGQVA